MSRSLPRSDFVVRRDITMHVIRITALKFLANFVVTYTAVQILRDTFPLVIERGREFETNNRTWNTFSQKRSCQGASLLLTRISTSSCFYTIPLPFYVLASVIMELFRIAVLALGIFGVNPVEVRHAIECTSWVFVSSRALQDSHLTVPSIRVNRLPVANLMAHCEV